MKTIRGHLGIKIFLSYLAVILVGAGVLAGTISLFLPGAFYRHMAGMSGMMGMMNGDHGMDNLFQSFRDGVYDALFLSILIASVVAISAGIFITRQIIAPVQDLSKASQRIAEGHYTERVRLNTDNRADLDELGQLAQDFNRMAENLEQTDALRRQLIGDISHELRTPLTAIKGSMEALIDGVLPAEPEVFEQIYKEADRLQHLVDDLQELSSIESGAIILELRPLNPGDLIKTISQYFDQQFSEKGVRLEINIDPDLPRIMADADRIRQVLINLVGNALQYTPAGGRVMVSTVYNADLVEVIVQDSGIGIAHHHLAHVFDRFYRVDRSRSRSSGGSGIGLTIARHLVEAHGGHIRVESPGPGKGSTFSFSIPVAKQGSNQSQPA